MQARQADSKEAHAGGRTRGGTRAVLPAQVFDAFGPDFLDGDRCRDWLFWQLHPAGPACPWCGKAINSPRTLASFRQLGRVQCTVCGRFFTALSGTLLSKTGLDPAGYVLLCLLLAVGMGDQAIARKLGVNRETVRRWRQRFAALELASSQDSPATSASAPATSASAPATSEEAATSSERTSASGGEEA